MQKKAQPAIVRAPIAFDLVEDALFLAFQIRDRAGDTRSIRLRDVFEDSLDTLQRQAKRAAMSIFDECSAEADREVDRVAPKH